jgi:acetyl esterase/lipase
MENGVGAFNINYRDRFIRSHEREKYMKRKSMIFIELIAIALSVSALAEEKLSSPLPEVAADVAKMDRYYAHDVTFPNGVRGTPGVVYWEPIGYRSLTLDLYLPPSSVGKPATGFPLAIYIHGGGWPHQQTLEMAEKLKSAGVKHELIVLPGLNHSFIGKTPEQTRDANLKALVTTFRFIDQTIGNAASTNR